MNKIPKGFRAAAIHSGIKSTDAEDITLIVADEPCVAVGVYTKNQVVAAPVVLDRERTPASNIRAVVVNSGNANACTGELGMRNAKRMTQLVAEAVGCAPEHVLVMSTGIIGEQLPMDKIEAGIPEVSDQLGDSESHLVAAARGIMTTDTKIKIASSSESDYSITGIAKGSGMIGPNMATMLATVMTDATLSLEQAQQILSKAVDRSFNSINVDGHTSTNDTVLLLSSGKGETLSDEQLKTFTSEFESVCKNLAKQIVDDGEGATHLIEISVTGAQSESDARTIAEAIANSPLVKTAFAGNDPNWGRIVSAAGYAGPTIDVEGTSLKLNGTELYRDGAPVEFDAEATSKGMQTNREVFVELTVGDGAGSATYWTCDLTHEYVTINAEYHT